MREFVDRELSRIHLMLHAQKVGHVGAETRAHESDSSIESSREPSRKNLSVAPKTIAISNNIRPVFASRPTESCVSLSDCAAELQFGKLRRRAGFAVYYRHAAARAKPLSRSQY